MLDGIDGSGKSTVMQAWKDYLAEQANAIFDLKSYWLESGEYPAFEELRSYDFIFSAEPTRTGIGKVIREELMVEGNNYPAEALAQAHSLDRLILYKKIIIPLLKDNKYIIQDRGVSSSLAYQTVQSPEMTFAYLSSLVGNKQALDYRPDHLVLLEAKPETAINRLTGRTEKKDNAIYEKLDFLTKLSAQYKSAEFRNIFQSRGATIHDLSGEGKADIMNAKAVNLLKQILSGVKA